MFGLAMVRLGIVLRRVISDHEFQPLQRKDLRTGKGSP